MKKKYPLGIFGPFDFNEKGIGGQSIKTKEFYYALRQEVGQDNVSIMESTGYRAKPFSYIWKLSGFLKNCEDVIIFPADKGIKVLAPVCVLFRSIFKTGIHYNVIGGWLPKLLASQPGLKKHLMKFDSILVETSVMKNELNSMGFRNIYCLPNLKIKTPVETVHEVRDTVKLCYFSRVTKLKGIEDAINVVNRVNASKTKCTFDIYGPVLDDYKERFETVQKDFPDYIRYKGAVDPRNSIEILQQYDIQLFPTQYSTEGIPGSIIDSYFAGTPVVSAMWNSFSDVVKDNITGIGYKQYDNEDFYSKMNSLIDDRTKIFDMKRNCLAESKKYEGASVINQFLKIRDSLK